MSIIFNLSGSYVLDESSGLQTPGTADTGNDVAVGTLPAFFSNRLFTGLGLSNTFATSVGVAASAANLATVTSTGALTGLKLTDSAGGLLDGDISDIKTLSGEDVYLWADSDDQIVLGKTAAGDVVFAVYMQPVLSADGKTATIKFWTVTFEPLQHDLAGTNPDDAVDLLKNVTLTATGALEFNFDTLPSGQNLFGTVGASPTSPAIVVIGKNPDLKADGTFTNTSDTINTSKGGGPTTIGVSNQMFDPGDGAYFTFVKNVEATYLSGFPGDSTQNEADDADNILYTGGTHESIGGFFRISQVQGNTLGTAKLTAYDISGTPQGRDFVTSLGTGTVVNITAVRVFNAAGVKIEDTDDLANFDSSTVSVDLSGLTAVVVGLNAGYRIEYDTAANHDRVLIEDLAGKFDIGAFGLTEGITEKTPLVNRVFVQDDGPTAAIATTGTKVVHDESPGLQTGGVAVPGEDNNDDDKALASIPAAFSALGTAIGWAQSASAVVTTSGSAYGTDGAGTTSIALKLSAQGADSGLKVLSGAGISLYTLGDLVVGRVNSGTGLGTPDPTGVIAIAIQLESDGKVSIAQYQPLFNSDPDSADEQDNIKDGVLFVEVTVKDGDNDTQTKTVDIGGKIGFEDDGPKPEAGQAPSTIEEDDLTLANSNGNSVGNNEDLSIGKQTTSTELSLQLSPGVDLPATFNLKDLSPSQLAAALPALTSKGAAVTYALALNVADADPDFDGADKVTATAGGRTIFTFVLQTDGTAVFTLLDQLDHVAGSGENTALRLAGGGSVTNIDFATLLDIRDADLDKVTLPADAVAFTVQDDIPLIGPIDNGLVDFTTINGTNPNDFGGTSTNSVTKSLNGSVGSDENISGTNLTADGTKTYTVTSFTSSITVNGVLVKGEASTDKTVVTYYQDINGNNTFDAGDVKFYDLVLSQTANSGAGSYTFTVYQDPPPALLSFNFDTLPSGQNLFGTVGVSPTSPAIVVIGKNISLKADGTFTNTSDTINTSKGGGPTTIGVNNQMFDPLEGAYFTFVKDVVATYLSGYPGGLDQNEADDADNILYTGGTLAYREAFFSVSQVQGNTLGTAKLTAYDISGAPQGRDFVTSLGSGTVVEITAVRVFNAAGTKIEDTDDLLHFNSSTVSVDLAGLTAVVVGINAGYRIEYDTAADHDRVLIEDVVGKFDIGGFGILQAQPTPDQQLSFTVQIADYDGDTASASFKIGIDGTGTFDNDTVDFT